MTQENSLINFDLLRKNFNEMSLLYFNITIGKFAKEFFIIYFILIETKLALIGRLSTLKWFHVEFKLIAIKSVLL